MRFFEIDQTGTQALAVVLKTMIGRARSKGEPARFNWQGFNQILAKNEIEPLDWETMDALIKSSPLIANLVHDYNSDGLELEVPGAPDADSNAAKSDSEQSKDKVNKMAASAAMNNISS